MRTKIRRDLRPIQCAIALSLLLHAAILAVSRSTPSLTTDPNTPIDLRLWIEAPGEQNIENDEIALDPFNKAIKYEKVLNPKLLDTIRILSS